MGLCCCVSAFFNCSRWGSSLAEVRRLPIAVASLAVHTVSMCGDFSRCSSWAQYLWLMGSKAQAQWLWCMSLVALWHVVSSWSRDGTSVPYIGRQILNNWITRETFHDTFDLGPDLWQQRWQQQQKWPQWLQPQERGGSCVCCKGPAVEACLPISPQDLFLWHLHKYWLCSECLKRNKYS